jgi:hypothetical protein
MKNHSSKVILKRLSVSYAFKRNEKRNAVTDSTADCSERL